MMDAMDVDWCLTCNKQTSHGRTFCSRTCEQRAMQSTDPYVGEFSTISDDVSSPSDALREPPSYSHKPLQYASSQRRHTTISSSSQRVARTHARTHHHHTPQQRFIDDELAARTARWPGYNKVGICEWRKNIPSGSTGSVVEVASIGPDMSSTYTRPEFPLSRQRPAGPALCTDTTQPARTSLRSSSPISAAPSLRSSTDAHVEPNYSFSTYSLRSALTESSGGVPESTRGHTSRTTQVHAENGNVARPSVLEGLARRFRTWGASPGAPPLKFDAPAKIFMETTTTTVPASPSPTNSPSSSISPSMQRSNTTRSNPKSTSSGFTIRASGDANVEGLPERTRSQVFDLRVPLANARSPLTIQDSELKDSIQIQPKRAIWIAGCEKMENGWAGFGPAHYERGFRDCKPPNSVDERLDREFREFEAFRARGRKAAVKR